MIKFVEVDNKCKPAIIIDVVDDIDDVRRLRKALVNIMEVCVSSENAKQFTSALSLWFLIRLIDDTTVECPKEEGGSDDKV